MNSVTTQRSRQAGATLMEVLVAMSISLVVTASMIALMSNSLSSTARIVNMTKLADDMRVAMQMVTRDLRRSSYNARSFYCYANDDCASDGSDLVMSDAISLFDEDNDGVDDCFTFLMDRDHDGDATENQAGGFRRVKDTGVKDPSTGEWGVYALEMWVGDSSANCNSGADWVQITDPEVVRISNFNITNDLSYAEVIQTYANGAPRLSQVIRKFRIDLQSELLRNPEIRRQVEDVVTVRNDQLVNHAPPIGP